MNILGVFICCLLVTTQHGGWKRNLYDPIHFCLNNQNHDIQNKQ